MPSIATNLLVLISLSGVFYGLYYFFGKLISGHMHQVAGAVILQLSAALVGALILAFLKFSGSEIPVSSKGVGLAVLAGLVVGVGEIMAFYAYSKGLPASTGIPILVALSVIVGVSMGAFVLKEDFGLSHVLGVLLVVCGLVVLTMKTG